MVLEFLAVPHGLVGIVSIVHIPCVPCDPLICPCMHAHRPACAHAAPQDIINFILVVAVCVVMTAMLLCIAFGARVAAVASPVDAITRLFQCKHATRDTICAQAGPVH